VKRRYPALIIVVVAVAAVIMGARSTRGSETATFSVAAAGWMPHASSEAGITETWFCPGVPAMGGDVQGEVVVANRSGDRMEGTVLLLDSAAANRRLDLAVEPWSSAVVDLDANLPGTMVGAVVEVEGGGAIVEQHSYHASGNSSTACATATSDAWYLAEGFTVEGSTDQIVLTNPNDQPVVADLQFATRDGARNPARYTGLTIAPRSVRVIDLGAPGAGAQSEPLLAVTVETSQGRLVVGRSQTYVGGGRLGTQVTLAQPAVRDQWWFANGHKGAGWTEQYSLYNPTDDETEVDVVFLGIPATVTIDPIEVPARGVVSFDPGTVADLPEGRYAIVFATLEAPSLVVERVSTQNLDGTVATSVVAGATTRPDGFAPTTWHVPRAPGEPTTEALVIHNADNAAGTVSVHAIGTSGPVPVPGLQELVLPAAGELTVDLTDPAALGRELIVATTNRVFVETAFPTGRDATRYSGWALPEG